MSSILIASPIHKSPAILEEFLKSLQNLDAGENTIYYCFVDDNEDLNSSQLLKEFGEKNSNFKLLSVGELPKNTGSELYDHSWTIHKIDKVAFIKNKMIEYFLSTDLEYMFFIDADLVLNPKTLLALLESEKDIISNIFWTKWNEDSQPLPQVWLKDFYTLYDDHMLIKRTPEMIQLDTFKFLSLLKIPGIYKVGGLGACTLIKRKVLEKGVNFSPIYNLSFWGEDRSFCIRAVAMGFELFVNTFYPAFHIFRPEELEHLPYFIQTGKNDWERNSDIIKNDESPNFIRVVREIPKITLSIIVKNEEKRYLRRVLESAKEYIDEAVIIDDGSTDNTVNLCKEILEGIPLKIIENKESKFNREWEIRKQQWNETIATNPDWIIFLDADEIFEDRFKLDVKELIKNKECDVYLFRLYDFWNEKQYREDSLWNAHNVYRPFMIRYQKNYNYEFLETDQHCGRLPNNIFCLNNQLASARLKHYGWAKEEDRIQKYNRYMKLDPDGLYGSLAQYQSILDQDVNLVDWIE